MKKQICKVLESTFIVYYSDYFRGAGIEVLLAVNAIDENDALKKLAINYLGWESDTPEIVDSQARQKYFFEGEVETHVLTLKTLLQKLEKKQIEVLFENRVPEV